MHSKPIIPLKNFIPAIAWFLLILVLLCLPGSAFPEAPVLFDKQLDKIIHCGLFAMLVFLWFIPFVRPVNSVTQKKKILFNIALSGLLYGIAMEFVQKYWIPNRSFDFFDILADGAGSFLPFVFFRQINKLKK